MNSSPPTSPPPTGRGAESVVASTAVDASPAAAAHGRYLGVRRFGSLDGLRAASILAVLWHHSGGPTPSHLLERGQLGVHLFFAISGYLITTLLIRERRRNGRVAIGAFFARRSLRIFPLYYAVLAVYVVAVLVMERGTDDGREFMANLPWFLTYTSNWFIEFERGERVIFYFAWSLATEEQFYLVFPWLVALLARRWILAVLGAAATVVFATKVGWLLPVIPADTLPYVVLWNIAPCITFGAAAAFVLDDRRGFTALWPLLGRRWSLPVVAVLTLAAAAPAGLGQAWEHVVYGLLVVVVIASVMREDHVLAPVLAWPPLVRLGVVSYGIYLMHMLSFNATDRISEAIGLSGWIGRMTIGVGLVWLAAEVSFRTFEAWFLKLKERFATR